MSLQTITSNETELVLTVLKNPRVQYSATNLAEKVGISPMGALKIVKNLEKEGLLTSKTVGKSIIYNIDMFPEYNKQYLKFLLQREAQQAKPYTKVWINELKKVTAAEIIILFGSILKKDSVQDIDVLFVTKELSKLKKEIQGIEVLSTTKIHPVFQSQEDFRKNIRKEDKALLSAIRGIVVKGEDVYMELMKT